MKFKIVTTVTSYVDVETMTPEHEVNIECGDPLPQQVVLLVATGGCKSAVKTLARMTDGESSDE
jgi:hypothetical protein